MLSPRFSFGRTFLNIRTVHGDGILRGATDWGSCKSGH